MGGGILQIAANVSNDSLFNDQNFTFFKCVYHKYTPFTLENYVLNLSSLSDFGKKMEVVIPKVGDLLTDMMLVVDLPQIKGEYTFTDRDAYIKSLQDQYTFSTMTDIQQYNENLYKLNLGANMQVYLVRDSVLGQYQLVLPLLDATMFLTQGKKQKYSLSNFLQNNSQFFDNQYKLHTIKDLVYAEKSIVSTIDYLNYAFQDKEFYFFIANLLNIKQINPALNIQYFNNWQNEYNNTIKKYILRRPEIVALDTFITNMNTELINSTKINDYVFNYENIFSNYNPIDYQYDIILPITYSKIFNMTFLPFENIINNKNYLYDYTSSFFSIFNKNYILVKRNNQIIGALTIKNIKDTSPLRINVQPFRHLLTNNTIQNKVNNVTIPLYIYYGINTIQNESINFAIISSIKNNINNVTEFLLDRSINIDVGDIIIVGINQTGITPINNYNNLYGIFKILAVSRTFTNKDEFTTNGYNTTLSVKPIEIDQLLLTDTLLINSTSNITTNTIYSNYNKAYADTIITKNDELVYLNNIKNIIYSDIPISSITTTPIKSITENILRSIIFSNDFLLTSDQITSMTSTVESYIYDSYDVFYNYLSKLYYKTIIKTTENQDYLNNVYYKINYTHTNNIYSFIGAGNTTFTNLENGTFRYQNYILKSINTRAKNDGLYSNQLSYTNFLTTNIINHFETFSDNYNNQWVASLLNIKDKLSDNFVKTINYLQYNPTNTGGRKTILKFNTSNIPIQLSNLTQLTFTYLKKDNSNTFISDYYSVSNIIPKSLITGFTSSSISFDLTSFILNIQNSFNLEYIDFRNSKFTYTTSSSSGIITINSLNTILDNYSNDLVNIINNNTEFTSQLYGNNILLDYISTQHETIFGYMKNYEINRENIIRNGGIRYSAYQEDIIDQSPLLIDGSYLIKFNSSEYYPRFMYSKQLQIYQNIYQKIGELSQNYLNETNHVYFINNINYPRTDGYNYKINNEGPLSYLDPGQLPLLMEPVEYSYNLLDKVSKYNIFASISPRDQLGDFSFITFLSDLEEHVPSLQKAYAELYWNNIFITNGVNSTTINNYISALSGKDDGLFMYYIYKYLAELYSLYSDVCNINTNIDDTYFKTIYQLSPEVLSKLAFSVFSSIMNTTTFENNPSLNFYIQYNSIIQNNQNKNAFKTLYESYTLLPQYNIANNTNFTNQILNMINEFSNIFYYIAKLTQKYTINIVLNQNLSLSNYPIIYKIHGSGNLIKIIFASDQYNILNVTDPTFTSTIAVPTGYNINEYYKIFNLSIHYDYMKYLFTAGYGGIQRDNQYPNKTLISFYDKINNYITANISAVDFAFFYANQIGLYLPNMEGNIVQSYQAWINKGSKPYFYYYNTLSIFYDMFYIYSGRSFISEYYTKDSNNNISYNNRPDTIRGETIYATRMAYGTRDTIGRLNGVSVRYNLLDQRLYSIINNFNSSNASFFDLNDDPIQIINILNNLNQRFTDHQEFLTLIKYSINITNPYPNTDIYLTLITQFKASSQPMTDLVLYQLWNDYILNYYKEQNYLYSSIINGLVITIDQYTELTSTTLDMSSVGYELHNFINNIYTSYQSNFSDTSIIKYLSNSNYHNICDVFIDYINSQPYFYDKNSFNNDFNYRQNNNTLIELDFIDMPAKNIFSVYQSDVSVFKELFKNILNYRQKNVSTQSVTIDQKKLLDDYYSINDVTSLTFYDKFFKFSNNVDYHLIPLIYHDLYNIQNASKTIVFYLNYLFSFLNNTSSKPLISDFDNPDLPVSYYFVKYLSSGVDYFLANFHQLYFDSAAFFPYKSVPSTVNLFNGTTAPRPKSFMYVFLLMKIQYRNYYYSFVENAYNYTINIETGVRQILSLNTFSEYPDIAADVARFDSIIDSVAVVGSIDHLQRVSHPFFVNKHVDNLLFLKDLLSDLENVSDDASINILLPNNDKYVEFLNERTIVTNSFDQNGLIFGGYPYTLGVMSSDNYMGSIKMIDSTGTEINCYIEGNVVLSSVIIQIYYFLISECFILNQTELIGSSFQLTPMALGNTLAQITAKDWKNGLINLISEYLFLLLKSKKIIYQNSIYEISYNDLYTRLRVLTGSDRLNDIVDMFLNSLLKISLSSFVVTTGETSTIVETYLAEYEQFKIQNDFSLITIKQNFNYSQYYRLMFALRQCLIGKYNNFEERVRFHNAYDYWKENNTILISDYQQITFNNENYMVRNSESAGVLSGLEYYSTNSTNIPTNLFTVIIDYIISNIQNSINKTANLKYSYFTKYDFKNFAYVKNGYDITLTLYNVYFNLPNERYNISINTGSKTISAVVVSGFEGNPFSISYSNLPFGYQYNFTTNKLDYLQLLYQYDITNVLKNMFTIFQNIQDINQSLTILSSYVPEYDPTGPNTSYYTFMHFPTFIESFIYYDFTSQTDPTKQVNAVLLPVNAKLGINTLFNLIFTNWSEFYGVFFYVYAGTNPTAADFLGSGKTVFSNGNYIGSLFMQFNTSGKIYLSITNGLIDETHPFGTSDVSVNITTPITVSSISDGSLDNNYAIITIPREIKITLFEWTLLLKINELYTFVANNFDGLELTNANGVPGIGDGPFPLEAYYEPGSNDPLYRINALLTFPESESLYIYVCDQQLVENFTRAKVFALIPNVSKAKTINIVNDVETVSKICTINDNTALLTVPKQYTVYLPYWSSLYRIDQLYVYFADNINGTNLGNDIGIINTPQTRATLTQFEGGSQLSFTAAFKNLGDNYVYLTFNQISDAIPYGSRPVNFLVNVTNPIVSTRIENVTGILSQYIAVTYQQTQFKVTLGNWLPEYINDGVNKLYIYTRDITTPDVYTNYIPINGLSNVNYDIVLENGIYVLYFTTTFTNISQLYLYLTFNKITSIYNYGQGLVNIQITNPPGDLVSFNYIDVIPAFYTDNIYNTLITFTTNNIQIHVNNYSPNYNIYKDIPNLLYLFLSSDSDPQNIYSEPIPIIFDENSILNYPFYTESVAPVFIFISDNSAYGAGLITYSVGFLVNQIGPINGILALPPFIINSKQTNFDIQLINWNISYNTINNINSIIVYIGLDPETPLVILGEYNIVFTDIFHLIFSTNFSITPGTYNIYIRDVNQVYFTQNLNNQVLISDQIQITTLIPDISPVSTFTSITYTGTLSSWQSIYPTSLNLFINQTLDSTIPVAQIITIDPDGNFSFTTQVTQFPTVSFALSESTVYSTGYLETDPFSITTIIGPVNAYFNIQSYVITQKFTDYSILLQNWDSTYPFSQLYVYVVDVNNNLLWNFGAISISLIDNIYYLIFNATIDNIDTGVYNVYISDTDFNAPGNNLSQLLTNQLSVIEQIALDHIDIVPSPFATYTQTTLTGYINNWVNGVFPPTLYIDYTSLYDNSYYTDTITIDENGIFNYIITFETIPGIIVGISDNITFGNGYLETNQLTLNNIIGPVNANLTTTPYAIKNLNTTYNIILTNWNTSYSTINNLYIYIGSDINTVVYTYGSHSIQFDGINYFINFSNVLPEITSGTNNIYLSDQDPTNIIAPPLVNQFISIFDINDQIIISNITPDPSPFQTYISTILNGQLTNWSIYYPTQLNIFYTTIYDNNTIQDIVNINSDGTFSYTLTENTLPGINLSIGDNIVFPSSYIQSNVYNLSSSIGPVNASIDNVNFIQNKSLPVIITLSNWNDSYNITQLYVYVGSDLNTQLESYGQQTIVNNTISFNLNSVLEMNTYNIYISDTDPTQTSSYIVRQSLVNQINIINQIYISNITPSIIPYGTYNDTIFNGQLDYWNVGYTFEMYVIYYSSFDNQNIILPITINSDGTFSFQYAEIYLADFNVYISDNSSGIYGNGYIESNIYTLPIIIGPVNASINIVNFIENKSLPVVITLPNWNDSYNITQLYIYTGSDPDTQIESYGQQTITYNSGIYTMSFSFASILTPNSYNIYISDTDPTITQTSLIRQSLITQIVITPQINISSITPTIPFTTYTDTTFNGNLDNWNSSNNTQMYVIYYSSYDNVNVVSPITINSDGTFSFNYTEIYLGDFNIYISDNSSGIYGNGYYESNVYVISSITIGLLDALLSNLYVIKDISTELTININNWNDSYNITQLYVYIGSDPNTIIQSFGLKTISSSTISLIETLSLTIGSYNIYLSDTDPEQTQTYLIREVLTNQLLLIDQIQIATITTTPTPLPTYTNANFTGNFSVWNIPPGSLYVFIASTIDNTTPSETVSIDSSGNFSFNTTVSNYNSINVAFSDADVYGTGYLESPSYNITTVIGPIDGIISPTSFNLNIPNNYTILLSNWNSSYGISELYVFTATDTSFTNLTLLEVSPVTIVNTNNVYTLQFNNTFVDNGPYYYVVSDVLDPINTPYLIYQTSTNSVAYADLSFTPILTQTSQVILNPTSINNLFLWYDATEIDGTYLDQPSNNSDVSTWINKVDNTINNLSSIYTPIKFNSTGLSNNATISFNNNGLYGDIPTNSFSNGISVFIVFKNIGSNTQNVVLFTRTYVDSNLSYPISVFNDVRNFSSDETNNYITHTIISPFDIKGSTLSTIMYFNNDSNLEYNEYINGTNTITESSVYYIENGNKIHIGITGVNPDNTDGFIGNISEILIFNRTLNETERQTIEGYIAWKWALITNLPSSHPYSYLNPDYTIPVNGYQGLNLFYRIILQDWVYNPNLTSFSVRYNQDINNPTDLVLIGNILITQDDNNNYILNFTVQFSTIGTYYIYLTDSFGNIYKSISTPISITDASSQITITPDLTEKTVGDTLTLTLNNWNSTYQINNFNIYYSLSNSDPSPTLIENQLIQYDNNSYSLSFIVPNIPGNVYFYIIGKQNNIEVIKNILNIQVIPNINPTANLSIYSNSIFNPNTISSLTLWLDANTISGTYLNQPNNGDPVSTWYDKSINEYNAVPANTNVPTFVSSGINNLPSIQLTTNYNYVIPIPTGTFTNGMFVYIVYQSNGTPTQLESLISRSNTTNADPFYAYNNIRGIGDGTNPIEITSPINIQNQTTPSLFNANIDSNALTYNEYNLFESQYSGSITNYNDTLNNNQLFIGTNSNFELQYNGLISEILIFNEPLTQEQKYSVEGYLAYKWNLQIYLPLNHPYSPIESIAQINAYTKITTLINIILNNWTNTSVSQVYIGYNTSSSNLDNLTNLGPFTINQLNNYYYITFSVVIDDPNTYYFHVLDQNNTEYTDSSKVVNVSNLIVDTVSTVDISENTPFNINLNNWSTIVNTIGLYSNQITNFDLSIGISTTDPSPVFVVNIPITYVNNNYILAVPGLVDVNNKYLYFTKTINGNLISIPPILISYFNISMIIDRNYGILNANETYNLTISSSIDPFNSEFPNVYLYYATIPDATLSDVTLIEYIVVSDNTITFTTNQTDNIIYFYISTDVNFTGYTASVGPIHFINLSSLSSNLDIYDTNTNTRNILLKGWSPYFSQITNLNVLSGSASDYSGQTLYKTLLIKTFTPTNIPNLNLWLDASTINNFIFDNSNYISQWTDGSINNNNATTSSFPIYNSINKGVNFSGGNYLNLPNGTIPYNDASYHIFIVLTPDDTTSTTQLILGSMDNTDTPTTNETNSFFIADNVYIQSWNNGTDLNSTNYTPNEKQLVSFEYLSEIGRSTYINTVLSGTDTQISNASSMYNNMIGGLLNNATFDNLIHEIIIYNTKLSTLERQKVENYLNNKWLI